ncbi:MAG: ABC transporter permease [Elusimicrobiales bacterium]|nr:ABC transporter permease [Elusimicrobiales bacterium]MCK5583762.1 ABC transporter permease [Elusimicrobiales bacterium]
MNKKTLKQMTAFLRKDFLIEISYKFAFISGLLHALIGILTFFFIDKLFGHAATPHLETFQTGYFSYVFLSMAFFNYAGAGLGSFAGKIREEQYQGTLEAVLSTPIKIPVFLISLSVWNFLYATFELIVYLTLGLFLFKIDISNINIPAFLTVFSLSIITFSAMGILSASFVIMFKRGNPIAWIFSASEGLLAGIFFPVSVLPPFLGVLSKFIPLTYSIKALELSVYRGYGIYALKNELLALAIFAIFLLPVSLWIFKYAINKSLKNGSLGQY